MTTTPFEPHPESGDEGVPAADPGQGAPEPAPGFGVGGEEPSRPEFPRSGDQSSPSAPSEFPRSGDQSSPSAPSESPRADDEPTEPSE